MKPRLSLYDALFQFVGQCAWSDLRHASVLVWMVMGVIHEGSVNLTRWLAHVQTPAMQAQSTQRRFSRWIQNQRIHPTYLYGRLIQSALADWQDAVMYLSFDTTMLWDQFCVMRLTVVYRGRAIPVIWRVLKHGSSSVKFVVYQDLLAKAANRLPADVKIVFLADRGFGDYKLMRYLRSELKWHYRIRVKSNHWVWRRGKGWQQLSGFHLNRGESLMLHSVKLFKRHRVDGVYLALARELEQGTLWLIVSSEPTTLQTLQEYGYRFSIEENFLDDKSNGFEWEDSGLRCPLAISRLCLVTAVATLYLTLQGTAVVAAKHRRWVDPHWFRGSSYFKIGWNWIKTALTRQWTLFAVSSLISNHDPDPVKASKSQYERQRYRFEFQVHTINYGT
ncbi:MAG: transposase [Leptolyngbyaceae cyanobacterium CSU_1_3]|nr:transposase [Leptolyngbyaceae cyanobacterium CSU_1_3]